MRWRMGSSPIYRTKRNIHHPVDVSFGFSSGRDLTEHPQNSPVDCFAARTKICALPVGEEAQIFDFRC